MLDDIITEFDDKRRIFHLSAKRPLIIKTSAELTDLCNLVRSCLSEHTFNERCYMIVDVAKIVIDPILVTEYMQKVKVLCEHYLYPEGLARYGYQITRVTATIVHQRYLQNDPHLFRNKTEAINYVEGLIEARIMGKDQKALSK